MSRFIPAGFAAVLVMAAGLLPALAAGGQTPDLNGSAYGAYVKVGLFGGQPNQVGAAPVVVLPPSGARQTSARPSIIGQFGPATILGGQFKGSGRNPTGKLTVTTEGTTSPQKSVTSTASVDDVGPGPLIADSMKSTCTSDGSGPRGSSTIVGGIVETKYDKNTQEPIAKQPIAKEPPPNTTIEGTIDHVGDRFKVVLNEQIVKGDTITVRAAHMYLLGDIAVGDLIIGQTVCGLSPDDGSTTPPAAPPGQLTADSTVAPAAAVTTVPAAAAKSSSGGGGSTGVLAGAGAAGLLVLLGVGLRVRKKGAPAPISEPDSSEG